MFFEEQNLSLPREPRCPAAQYEQTVVAPNQGVRCRVRGGIRDAEGSPCVGSYAGDGSRPPCAIWKGEKERLWASKRAERMRQASTPDGWVAA